LWVNLSQEIAMHEIERKVGSATLDFVFTRASSLPRRLRYQLPLNLSIETFQRLQHFVSGDRDARISYPIREGGTRCQLALAIVTISL
jgi:hypothetical protein